MPADIRRKVELVLCAYLTERTGGRWHPEKGDDEHSEIEPPCGIVDASAAQDVVPGHSIHLLDVQVIWATHISQVKPREHSEMVDSVDLALREFPKGQYQDVVISGLDVQRMDTVEDTERKVRGDVLFLSVGATG